MQFTAIPRNELLTYPSVKTKGSTYLFIAFPGPVNKATYTRKIKATVSVTFLPHIISLHLLKRILTLAISISLSKAGDEFKYRFVIQRENIKGS